MLASSYPMANSVSYQLSPEISRMIFLLSEIRHLTCCSFIPLTTNQNQQEPWERTRQVSLDRGRGILRVQARVARLRMANKYEMFCMLIQIIMRNVEWVVRQWGELKLMPKWIIYDSIEVSSVIINQMFHQEVDVVRSKYAKIPAKNKINFLREVIYQSSSIKHAAALYNINYSTAKTLIRMHRFNMIPYDLSQQPQSNQQISVPTTSLQRCSYKEVPQLHTKTVGDSETSRSLEVKVEQGERRETGYDGTNLQQQLQRFYANRIKIISSVLLK